MHETITAERSAVLLTDAGRFIGRKLPTWPEELQRAQFAALLARGWKGSQKADYSSWLARIVAAIDAGYLSSRAETRESITPGRLVRTGQMGCFVGISVPIAYTRPASTTVKKVIFINQAAAAQWLGKIGFDFGIHEHIRAWLGDELRASAPRSRTGRPSTIDRNSKIVKGIVEAFEAAIGPFSEGKMPPPKADFLDACRRIEKSATNKTSIFGNIKADGLTNWLKGAGFSFRQGSPKGGEDKPYTKNLPAIASRIPNDLFTGNSS